MKDMMKVDGIPEEVFDEMFPVDQPQFYVLTNPSAVDGSCAMLSDSFMQKVAETVGSDEFYIIPSSRHEVLAINPNIIDNPEDLKSMVMEVNRTEVSNADFLSDNVYKYNAHTHSIMMGNDKGHLKDKETATISKSGKLFESMGRK